jgi:hypothetical protein
MKLIINEEEAIKLLFEVIKPTFPGKDIVGEKKYGGEFEFVITDKTETPKE